MKKRSLFAAVAMLIVSAIILTSATYAWFATGGQTKISTITGKVADAGAGIRLRTTPTSSSTAGFTGWVSSLDYVKLAKVNGNNFATNYTDTGALTGTFNYLDPTDENAKIVRVDPSDNTSDPLTYEPISTQNPNTHTNANPTIFAYRLDGSGAYQEIESGKDMNKFYDVYSFYVATMAEDEDASTNDTDINMTVQISGSAASAARVAIYTSDDNGSTWNNSGAPHIYSGASESANGGWKPLVGALDLTNYTYRDNGNYILDVGNGGTLASDCADDTNLGTTRIGSAVTTIPASTAQTIRLHDCHVMNNASNLNKLVRVYVWLEGQDTDCAPSNARVPGGEISVAYTFALAETARNASTDVVG